MTPSATVRGGRQATWTRDNIIDALRRYAQLYGADFTAAAFSPSQAKWGDRPELIDRYYDGDPETGARWPSLNAIKSHFDNSFDAAREAAGFEPNRSGPSKRRREGHRPIRDERVRRVYVEKVEDRKKVEVLERRAERLEARAVRLADELARSRAAKRVVTTRVKTKTKTVTKLKRVADDAAVARARDRAAAKVARAEAKALEARAAVDAMKRDLVEARQAATRLAARLERAEATINTLRAERRELKSRAEDAEDAAAAAKSMLSQSQEAVERLRGETRVVVRDAPGQAEIDAARAESDAALAAQRAAEVRAARAEREYRELAVAARGEERKLTKAELDELRASGPSGPALVAAALKDLGAARKTNNPTALRAALWKIASAAVSWRERL